jgi:hypothetical protein
MLLSPSSKIRSYTGPRISGLPSFLMRRRRRKRCRRRRHPSRAGQPAAGSLRRGRREAHPLRQEARPVQSPPPRLPHRPRSSLPSVSAVEEAVRSVLLTVLVELARLQFLLGWNAPRWAGVGSSQLYRRRTSQEKTISLESTVLHQCIRSRIGELANGALYSVTYSWLSKSGNNIDVPLARPVRAASITSAR